MGWKGGKDPDGFCNHHPETGSCTNCNEKLKIMNNPNELKNWCKIIKTPNIDYLVQCIEGSDKYEVTISRPHHLCHLAVTLGYESIESATNTFNAFNDENIEEQAKLIFGDILDSLALQEEE